MQKIKLEYFKEFRDNQCSMQETSKDSSKSPVQFMTHRTERVFNFDKVKTMYMNRVGLSEELAHSVDAIWENDAELYMVEFKNGDIESQNISAKARDSVMIFNSITERQIEYTRRYMNFILVYNEDVQKRIGWREQKALGLAKMGRQDYAMWGLGKLRGFCFKKVYTLNKQEFEVFMEKESRS